MSNFYDDLNEDMKDPYFAYQYGKDERELEIISLLENERRQCEKAGLFTNDPELREQLQTLFIGLESAIKIIRGESNDS